MKNLTDLINESSESNGRTLSEQFDLGIVSFPHDMIGSECSIDFDKVKKEKLESEWDDMYINTPSNENWNRPEKRLGDERFLENDFKNNYNKGDLIQCIRMLANISLKKYNNARTMQIELSKIMKSYLVSDANRFSVEVKDSQDGGYFISFWESFGRPWGTLKIMVIKLIPKTDDAAEERFIIKNGIKRILR